MTEVIYFVPINGSLLVFGVLGSFVLSQIRWESPLHYIAWMSICGLSCALISPVVAALGWLLSIPTNSVVLFAGSFSMVIGSMLYFKRRESKTN